MSSENPRPWLLITEDDDEIREAFTEILDDGSIEVASAANGREALDLLRSGRPHPFLILLDLRMPVMDGVTFCAEKAKDASLKDIPVVVMSADRSLEGVAGKGSVQGHLKKPTSIDEILATVNRFRPH